MMEHVLAAIIPPDQVDGIINLITHWEHLLLNRCKPNASPAAVTELPFPMNCCGDHSRDITGGSMSWGGLEMVSASTVRTHRKTTFT